MVSSLILTVDSPFSFSMYRIPQIAARLLKPWIILAFPGRRSRSVYLTFDDGPDPSTTPEILSLLSQYNACASFFPEGIQADLYPDLIEKIRESGHSIHLHSWSHDRKKLKSLAVLRDEINRCRSFSDSLVYRPPYGRFTLRQLCWLRSIHFRIVLWNVSPRDYSDEILSEHTLNQYISRIRPGDIILLHNRLKFRDKTLKLAHKILHDLTRKNLTFEKII